MKFKLSAIAALCCASLANANDLVITEIMQNPSAVGDSSGEWFEVYNAGSTSVDLSGWTVQDNDNDSFVIQGSLTVPAGGFVVFGNNDDTATNGGVNVDYDYGSAFFLSNSSDELVLLNTLGEEVDRVEWDGGDTFPSPTGASMELADPASDNSVGGNWAEATTAYGNGDLGTPGSFSAVDDGGNDDGGNDDGNDGETPVVSPTAYINEIRIDQPSSDNDEYVELLGQPGASLEGYTYIVIGDGSGGSGVIESITDLSAGVFDENGLFVVAESTFTLGTADLIGTLSFENSDNVTHMLVRGFTGSNQQDLDTNDDGVLDITPFTSIVDSVSLVETPESGELYYSSTTVGPDGSFVPGHVYRVGDGIGEFVIGGFSGFPDDTPGQFNSDLVISINEIRIDQPSADNDEYFELFGRPFASLDGLTYLVIGDGNVGAGSLDAVVDLTGSAIGADGIFLATESTFSGSGADLVTSLNFENSDNVTHMLVSDFTGSNSSDLDVEDNGELDGTLYSAVLDSIALVETPDTGDAFYGENTVGPDGNFVPGHVYRVTDGSGDFLIGDFGTGEATETPGARNSEDSNGGGNGGGNVSLGICGDEATFISAIQGSGDASPETGNSHVIEGIVSHVTPGLAGFFMQEEAADEDGDAATSEGIFVSYNLGDLPSVGEQVRVLGSVSENFGRTQLSAAETFLSCGTGSVVAVETSLPFPSLDDAEALEGMLVEINQDLVVSSSRTLGAFGEVTVSNGRLFKSTQLFEAGTAEERALEAANQLNQVKIDDNFDGSFNNPTVYPNTAIGGLSASNSLRAGDTVSYVTGVMDYGFSHYRIRPTVEPEFLPTNPRTDEPVLAEGNLKVASFNVLNYFTTFNARGAENAAEFERQAGKIVAALSAMDADIVGLMEMENNGFGNDSAINDLVTRLNAEMGPDTYAYVDLGAPVGTDQIMVAIIYKPGSVTPSEAARVLDSSNSPLENGQPLYDDGRNRPSVAQKFTLVENGEQIVVNVNHFKSKGSGCGEGDDDTTTGQGNCNGTRENAAKALSQWLAAEYADESVVIVGDLNAYAKEDPILALIDGGFTDLARYVEGQFAYSYQFDEEAGSLDYALANGKALADVVDVTDWHINSDEPQDLDYNDIDGQEALEIKYYAEDPYRASDHDPVIVSLQIDAAVTALTGDVDGNGVIDFSDYGAILGMLGSVSGDDRYNTDADFDEDGTISFNDLQLWYQLFLAQ